MQSDPTQRTVEGGLTLARRVAWIMGPASGAARAVERYDLLTAAGFQSDIMLAGPVWLVKEPGENWSPVYGRR